MYKDPYIGFNGDVPCVIYDRFSNITQKITSSERQVNLALSYAINRGWTPVASFSDKAESGRKKSRPALDSLFAHCKENPGTAIIVEDLSRLARSDLAFANSILQILESGAFMYDAYEGFFTPKRLFQEAAYAIESAEVFLQRCQEGHDLAGLSGKCMGRVPYGYRKRSDGYLDIDPATSKVVVEIFERIAAREPVGVLVADLAARRIKSPGGKAKWSSGSIRRICENKIYTGQLSHRRKTYPWDIKLKGASK